MSDENWYRNKKWNKEIEDSFFARFKRSRGDFSRSQQLRIQGASLLGTKKKENVMVAKMLLERCDKDYPDDPFRAATYLDLAMCRAFLGDVVGAIEDYRRAVKREIDYPNMSCYSAIAFSYFVAEKKLEKYYDEILNELERMKTGSVVFPADRYRLLYSMAIIYQSKKDYEFAKKFALEAINEYEKTSSGFTRHKLFGLVKKDDSINEMKKIVKPRWF
jgi:tetratricopeptide (TPR) repeat protein